MIQLREAGRVQTAEAQGKAFMFGAQEKRDMQKLNRLAGQQQNYLNQAQQLQGQQASLFGGALGAVGSALGAAGGQALYYEQLKNR